MCRCEEIPGYPTLSLHYQSFIQDFWLGGEEVCGGIAAVCVGVREHAAHTH